MVYNKYNIYKIAVKYLDIHYSKKVSPYNIYVHFGIKKKYRQRLTHEDTLIELRNELLENKETEDNNLIYLEARYIAVFQ